MTHYLINLKPYLAEINKVVSKQEIAWENLSSDNTLVRVVKNLKTLLMSGDEITLFTDHNSDSESGNVKDILHDFFIICDKDNRLNLNVNILNFNYLISKLAFFINKSNNRKRIFLLEQNEATIKVVKSFESAAKYENPEKQNDQLDNALVAINSVKPDSQISMSDLRLVFEKFKTHCTQLILVEPNDHLVFIENQVARQLNPEMIDNLNMVSSMLAEQKSILVNDIPTKAEIFQKKIAEIGKNISPFKRKIEIINAQINFFQNLPRNIDGTLDKEKYISENKEYFNQQEEQLPYFFDELKNLISKSNSALGKYIDINDNQEIDIHKTWQSLAMDLDFVTSIDINIIVSAMIKQKYLDALKVVHEYLLESIDGDFEREDYIFYQNKLVHINEKELVTQYKLEQVKGVSSLIQHAIDLTYEPDTDIEFLLCDLEIQLEAVQKIHNDLYAENNQISDEFRSIQNNYEKVGIKIDYLQNKLFYSPPPLIQEPTILLACRLGKGDVLKSLLPSKFNKFSNSCNVINKLYKEPGFLQDEELAPIHVACRYGQTHIMQILHEQGANLAFPSRKGFQPIHFAIQGKDYRSVEWLLDHGTDVDSITLPFQDCHLDSQTMELKLEDNGFCTSTLQNATYQGAIKIANLLIRHGASLDHQNYTGQTALHLAVLKDDIDILTLLLKNNANATICDHQGYSPLYYTVIENKQEMYKCFNKWGKCLTESDLRMLAKYSHDNPKFHENIRVNWLNLWNSPQLEDYLSFKKEFKKASELMNNTNVIAQTQSTEISTELEIPRHHSCLFQNKITHEQVKRAFITPNNTK